MQKIDIHLIQRGTVRRPLVDDYLSNAVKLDAMGASEFEWGALPKSLRALEAVQGDLALVTFPEIRREDGRVLKGLGVFSGERRDAYASSLVAVVEHRMRCHEWTNLPEAMQPSKHIPPYAQKSKTARKDYLARLTNFWWDIENDVMLSFDDDFMRCLPGILRKSWDKMNASAAERSASPSASESGSAAAPVSVSASTSTSNAAAASFRGVNAARTSGTRYGDDELKVEVGAVYDGKVVTNLRTGKGRVHSLLVDIGGKVGRLALTDLRGSVRERQKRILGKGDNVRVRVVYINAYNGRFVLSERTAA